MADRLARRRRIEYAAAAVTIGIGVTAIVAVSRSDRRSAPATSSTSGQAAATSTTGAVRRRGQRRRCAADPGHAAPRRRARHVLPHRRLRRSVPRAKRGRSRGQTPAGQPHHRPPHLPALSDTAVRGSPEVRQELLDGPNPFDPGSLRELRTAAESRQVNDPRMPCIIISASGMATGGRVLHHLRPMLPDPKHTVLIVGFAAAGTRAAQLAGGARVIKIHGRYVPVRADIVGVDSFSAHADATELVDWATAAAPPRTAYLVHGEPTSAQALADRLASDHDWPAVVPHDDERVLL